jgi:hypothetical protein
MKRQHCWLWPLCCGIILFIFPAAGTAAPPKRVISAKAYHTLAIQKDGSLWAWGANSHGQLGLGDLTQRTMPTKVLVGTG